MDKDKLWNEVNLSPTEAKRQHYVPQFLLKPFAVDGKIMVFDFIEDKKYWTALKNAAVETGFYNMNVNGQNVSNENWLSIVEQLATPLIERLITQPDCITKLSGIEEMKIARFLTAQRIRTPAYRNNSEKMSDSMLEAGKESIRKQLFAKLPKKKAERLWADWSKRPKSWWFKEKEPIQPAMTSSFMLGEIQGLANILRAAPWRIGIVPETARLYTSDNPVAGYLRPVRIWGEGAAFSSYDYYVSLSPRVLLKIERRPIDKGKIKPQGERKRKDFSAWECSFAENVISSEAIRYLYGEGPIIDPKSASAYIERTSRALLEFAMTYLGHDPGPIPNIN